MEIPSANFFADALGTAAPPGTGIQVSQNGKVPVNQAGIMVQGSGEQAKAQSTRPNQIAFQELLEAAVNTSGKAQNIQAVVEEVNETNSKDGLETQETVEFIIPNQPQSDSSIVSAMAAVQLQQLAVQTTAPSVNPENVSIPVTVNESPPVEQKSLTTLQMQMTFPAVKEETVIADSKSAKQTIPVSAKQIDKTEIQTNQGLKEIPIDLMESGGVLTESEAKEVKNLLKQGKQEIEVKPNTAKQKAAEKSSSVVSAFFDKSESSAIAREVKIRVQASQSQVQIPVVKLESGSEFKLLPNTMIIASDETALSANNPVSKDNTKEDSVSVLTAFGLPQEKTIINTTIQTTAIESPVDTEIQRKIIDQIVKEVKLTKSDGKSDLILKLTPPELGTLKIHLTKGADGITSHIQADSVQVKKLLESHIPSIIESLNIAGVKVDKVTVASESQFTSMQKESTQSGYQSQPNQSGKRSNFLRQFATVDQIFSEIPIISDNTAINASHSWLA